MCCNDGLVQLVPEKNNKKHIHHSYFLLCALQYKGLQFNKLSWLY
jgi:hypothetical protein